MTVSEKKPQRTLNLRHSLAFAITLTSIQVLRGSVCFAQTSPPTTAPATAPKTETPAASAPMTPAEARAAEFKKADWDTRQAGRELNLDGYKITFEDNFDRLSVTPDGGKGPWFAPVRTPFGASRFLPPDPDGPFSVADGILTIRAEKRENEKEWRSGLMQTVDFKGQGFVQQYGYFEMRAQFPNSPGAWPAFWLLSQNGWTDPTKTRAEIDIVEWYGADPKGHHASVHLWPPAKAQPDSPPKHLGKSQYSNYLRWDSRFKLPADPMKDKKLEGWHTYGSEVTPEWVIVYFDRHELARFPTQPEYKTPLYMLVNLALKDLTPESTNPMEMKVDYVQAYAKG